MNISAAGSTTTIDGGLTVNEALIVSDDLSGNDASFNDISAVNFFSVGSSFFGDVHATTASSFGDISGNDASFNDISAVNLNLRSDGSVISLGANADVKITHVADSGLILKNTSTGDNTPFVLTLQTDETIVQNNDQLGVINFQAPNEANTGDARLIAAGIAAVAEGTFNSTSNATKLSFKTASSEEAAEKMKLSSTGVLTLNGLAGSIVIPDDGNIGSASDTNAIAISSTGVVTISANVTSTDKDSGALVISNGGAGIEGDLNVGGTLTAGSIVTTQVNVPLDVVTVYTASPLANKIYAVTIDNALLAQTITLPTNIGAVGNIIKFVFRCSSVSPSISPTDIAGRSIDIKSSCGPADIEITSSNAFSTPHRGSKGRTHARGTTHTSRSHAIIHLNFSYF